MTTAMSLWPSKRRVHNMLLFLFFTYFGSLDICVCPPEYMCRSCTLKLCSGFLLLFGTGEVDIKASLALVLCG